MLVQPAQRSCTLAVVLRNVYIHKIEAHHNGRHKFALLNAQLQFQLIVPLPSPPAVILSLPINNENQRSVNV